MYFADGSTASEAIQSHENSIVLEYGFEKLASAAVNPTARQVYYLYNVWRSQNFGPLNPFEKLCEKQKVYEEKGKKYFYVFTCIGSISVLIFNFFTWYCIFVF